MLEAPLHESTRELNDSVMKSGREKAVDLILSRDNPQRAVEQGLISGREALEWLVRGDREGKYVFHGTPFEIKGSLEPRQAYSHGRADGTPAVAAIASPDVPIFMAIISSGRDRMAGRQHHSSWGGEGNTFTFKSWPDQLERARKEQHPGWVYVFRSDEFHAYRGQEVRSEVPVKPEYCVPVAYEDLPGAIEDIEQGT